MGTVVLYLVDPTTTVARVNANSILLSLILFSDRLFVEDVWLALYAVFPLVIVAFTVQRGQIKNRGVQWSTTVPGF